MNHIENIVAGGTSAFILKHGFQTKFALSTLFRRTRTLPALSVAAKSAGW
jgi:hypothetical protein